MWFSQYTHRPGRPRSVVGELAASMYPPVNTSSTTGSPALTRILATTVMLGTAAIGIGATMRLPSTTRPTTPGAATAGRTRGPELATSRNRLTPIPW